MVQEDQAEQERLKRVVVKGAPPTPQEQHQQQKKKKKEQQKGPSKTEKEDEGPQEDGGYTLSAAGLAVLLIGAVRCGLLQTLDDSVPPLPDAAIDTQAWMRVWSARAVVVGSRAEKRPQQPTANASSPASLAMGGGGGSGGGFGVAMVAGVMAAASEGPRGLRLPPDVIYVLVGGFLEKALLTVSAREELRNRQKVKAAASRQAGGQGGRRDVAPAASEGENKGGGNDDDDERDGLGSEQLADVLEGLVMQRCPLPGAWLEPVQKVLGLGVARVPPLCHTRSFHGRFLHVL